MEFRNHHIMNHPLRDENWENVLRVKNRMKNIAKERIDRHHAYQFSLANFDSRVLELHRERYRITINTQFRRSQFDSNKSNTTRQIDPICHNTPIRRNNLSHN